MLHDGSQWFIKWPKILYECLKLIKLVLRSDEYFFHKVLVWVSDSGHVFGGDKTFLGASDSFRVMRIISVVPFTFIVDEVFLFIEGGNGLNFKAVGIFVFLFILILSMSINLRISIILWINNILRINNILIIMLILLGFLSFDFLKVKFIMMGKLRYLVHGLIVLEVWVDFLFPDFNLLSCLVYEGWLKLIASMTVGF